jgi:prevent-host-death family protein
MRIVTSVEAQNKFGELIDSAQREPVTITRRGRTVAYLLSPADIQELIDARQRRERNLANFDTFFAASDAKLTPAAHQLNDAEIVNLVNAVR